MRGAISQKHFIERALKFPRSARVIVARRDTSLKSLLAFFSVCIIVAAAKNKLVLTHNLYVNWINLALKHVARWHHRSSFIVTALSASTSLLAVVRMVNIPLPFFHHILYSAHTSKRRSAPFYPFMRLSLYVLFYKYCSCDYRHLASLYLHGNA